MFLWIVRCPVLTVQQRIRNARVRLVEPHYKTARRQLNSRGLLTGLRRRQRGADRLGQTAQLDMLALQHLQQLQLAIGLCAVPGQDIGSRPLIVRLLHRPLALGVEVLQKVVRVLCEVRERGEQCGLLIVVVIALRPHHYRQRRILPVPGARILLRLQDALFRVRSAVAEGLIQPADAVMHRRQEHQISRAPGIEVAVRKDPRHTEALHLRDVVPAQLLPLIHQRGIDPRVVGPIAHGVVVEIRH